MCISFEVWELVYKLNLRCPIFKFHYMSCTDLTLYIKVPGMITKGHALVLPNSTAVVWTKLSIGIGVLDEQNFINFESNPGTLWPQGHRRYIRLSQGTLSSGVLSVYRIQLFGNLLDARIRDENTPGMFYAICDYVEIYAYIRISNRMDLTQRLNLNSYDPFIADLINGSLTCIYLHKTHRSAENKNRHLGFLYPI